MYRCLVAGVAPIVSERLSLVVLDAPILSAMEDGADSAGGLTWPAWWPDDVDRRHVSRWRARAAELDGRDEWRPRAIVELGKGEVVGHAGFHQPPRSLDEALADARFTGSVEPSSGGVVEIGYTIFPAQRRRGYATEVVVALAEWAFQGGEVSTVIGAAVEDNQASLAVLELGGFHRIGSWLEDDGTVEVVLRRDKPSGV